MNDDILELIRTGYGESTADPVLTENDEKMTDDEELPLMYRLARGFEELSHKGDGSSK